MWGSKTGTLGHSKLSVMALTLPQPGLGNQNCTFWTSKLSVMAPALPQAGFWDQKIGFKPWYPIGIISPARVDLEDSWLKRSHGEVVRDISDFWLILDL